MAWCILRARRQSILFFTATRCGFRIAHGRWKGRPVRIMWFHRANHLYGCRLWRRMGNPHGHRQLNWDKVGRVRRCSPNLLYQLLAHCRAKWARPTSMGEGFLSMLVFFIAGEKRRAYPAAIEKPRQPLDNRPCVLPGLLCSWKMCYACSNCELYSSA